MTTTFMNLTLPTVSTTIGPQWATELNAAVTTIDSHDHSSGKGTKITQTGINITGTLELNNNALTEVGQVAFDNLSTLLTSTNLLQVKDGDLYYNDSSSNQIRITAGGALDVGSIGGIGGDYGSTAATVFYTDAAKTYFFQDSTAARSKIDIGSLVGSTLGIDATTTTVTGTTTNLQATTTAVSGTTCTISNTNTTVSGTTTTLSATTTNVSSPTTNLSGTTTNLNGTTVNMSAATIDITGTVDFQAAPTGFGVVPLGAIIPIASNLTGAHTIPASGVMDAAGWQYCDGAAISASATMSGTIYNLTDDRFIQGSSTAGVTGGSNTIVDHTHSFSLTAAGQSGGSTTTGGQSNDHTHGGTTSGGGDGFSGFYGTATGGANPDVGYLRPGATHTHAFSTGGVSAGHTHSVPSHTHNSSSVSGSIGSGSAPTSTNSRPKYVSAQYIMRVK